MARAEQIKAILKSYIEKDDTRFYSLMMQVAASEARMGHGKLAEELKKLVDQARTQSVLPLTERAPIPISLPRGELTGLLSVEFPKLRLVDMVLPQKTNKRLLKILKEHRNIGKLKSHGLEPRRKLLLIGSPGCGKTMTAAVLAGELGIPHFTVRLDGLITKFLGETAAKLKMIFDSLQHARGVYLFDEFDAIGSQRAFLNDVGEIRRVLNSFLMLIERDKSNSLIVAATNHHQNLDYALFRRFDDVIEYELPKQEQIEQFLKSRLSTLESSKLDFGRIALHATGLSYADIAVVSDEVIKDMILEERPSVKTEAVLQAVTEKKSFHKGKVTP